MYGAVPRDAGSAASLDEGSVTMYGKLLPSAPSHCVHSHTVGTPSDAPGSVMHRKNRAKSLNWLVRKRGLRRLSVEQWCRGSARSDLLSVSAPFALRSGCPISSNIADFDRQSDSQPLPPARRPNVSDTSETRLKPLVRRRSVRSNTS
jgi:hypothetical protein